MLLDGEFYGNLNSEQAKKTRSMEVSAPTP